MNSGKNFIYGPDIYPTSGIEVPLISAEIAKINEKPVK
jgi:hypothetical protein